MNMNNYKILRQRIQDYIASLVADAKSDEEISERTNCLSIAVVGKRKKKIAEDLSDILQALPNE